MIESFPEALPCIPDSDIRNWVGPFQEKTFYHELGLAQARKVRDWLHISKSSSVLDLGCGCGRLALHFLDEIAEPGRYCGVDCSKDLIAFCRQSLGPRNGAFRFHCLDARNGSYNPGGACDPTAIKLPFPEGSFSSALAWSVFTHMDFASVRHYVGELSRVLAAQGVFCFSMNLHDSGTLRRIARGQSSLDLSEMPGSPSYVLDPRRPEDCYSHERHAMEAALEESGFEILESLEGWWSHASPRGEYHDCMVCRKTPVS